MYKRQVLIKVHKTAICGTDLHIYNWDAWSRKNIVPPLIIGHEYVGEIAELGPNVDGLTVGERVSGEGHIVCHHCRNCRAGNGQWCKFTKGVGVNRDGAFAEYVCIPASNVIPINPEIDEDVVAFFDAFGNATHTALMFDVVGEDVLITGAGSIGMMAAAICRRNGARTVVVTDVNDYRLEMAKKMGKQDIADEFYKRSQNYKNVYNPATSFMQPRDDKGIFIKDFKADDYTPHICESNGWQYFWSVQHDINGLIALVGGKNRFAEKLDSMFTYHPAADDELPIFSTGMIGQYAHGNEPSHHVIYLFNAIGHENRTQEYVAKVMNELYKNEPAGLCGNEDCGQMSAWYVFSAMGFYPVNPVSGKYEIGTPLFPEMQLHLANGKTFTVLAPKVNKENIYIQSIKIDGKPYDKTYLTHEQIMSGATVEFEMSNTPKAIGVIFEDKKP